MPQATQAFNGIMFITNPFEKQAAAAFIRVDVLERRFADSIKASSNLAVHRCGHRYELYEMYLLNTLRDQFAALTFPHDQLFKREAERQGFQLDDERYHAVKEVASTLWEEFFENMI